MTGASGCAKRAYSKRFYVIEGLGADLHEVLLMQSPTGKAGSLADMPSSQKEHLVGLGGKELGCCPIVRSFVPRLELLT